MVCFYSTFSVFLTTTGDDLYVDIKCNIRYGSFLSERIVRHVQAEVRRLGLEDD